MTDPVFTYVSGNLSTQSFCEAVSTHAAAMNNLCVRYDHRISDASHIQDMEFREELFTRYSSAGSVREAVGWTSEGVLLWFDLHPHSKSCQIVGYGNDVEAVKDAIREGAGWVVRTSTTDEKVSLGFWAMGVNGPTRWERTIEVPEWPEVEQNYTTEVKEEVERVVRRDFGLDRGKLILWHGPAGTGKTYAVRTLLREWNTKNVTFSYIVDPEKFFSTDPDYMLRVLLDSDYYYRSFEDDVDLNEEKEQASQLLILEDTGELLHADAKERTGQGLSRLLNVMDGLIGQGLNLTALLTTNEEVDQFHPAVTRPGRCLSKLHFGPFSAKEANGWLHSHGSDAKVKEDKTLAELFAILHDTYRKEEESVEHGMYL